MAVPAAAPKKPANQGGMAPANVQPVNHQEKAVSHTNALPHQYSSSNGVSEQQQRCSKQPGGTRGSGKGTR